MNTKIIGIVLVIFLLVGGIGSAYFIGYRRGYSKAIKECPVTNTISGPTTIVQRERDMTIFDINLWRVKFGISWER